MKEKKSFFDSLQNGLLKISDVVNRNIYIMAIKDGMLAYMPFAFIASIFLKFSIKYYRFRCECLATCAMFSK